MAHMAGVGRKDHVCSTTRVELPVKPRRRSVFVVRCPTGPVSDCPLVVDGNVYWRRESNETFIAGCSPPKVRFSSLSQPVPLLRFLSSSYTFFFLSHLHLLTTPLLSLPLSFTAPLSIFLPLSFQHLDRDADGVELDVDHTLFEEYVWPKMANRVPAFEALKVKFALEPS